MGQLAAAALIGAWDLVDWRIDYDDGRPAVRPFGPDAEGQICYTADGHMSAVIQRTGRRPLSTPSPRQAPAEECREAYTGFFCYAGGWTLEEGDTVVHRLTLALNPAMLGTEQRRHARLDDDLLELSASEALGHGRTRTHRLSWRRAPR